MSNIQPPVEFKTTGIAYLFWLFLGALGGHKFYLGKTRLGVAYLCTLGFLGIGVLIDLFTLPKQVKAANDNIARNANAEIARNEVAEVAPAAGIVPATAPAMAVPVEELPPAAALDSAIDVTDEEVSQETGGTSRTAKLAGPSHETATKVRRFAQLVERVSDLG